MLKISHPRDRRENRKGKTIVMDIGPTSDGWTGKHGLEDFLDVAGIFVDAVKLWGLNLAAMPEKYLREVIALYKKSGVMIFAGGLLFEYAYLKNEIDGLIQTLKHFDVDGIEVSENYITLTWEERMRYIDQLSKAGIDVVFEYGRKHPDKPMDIHELEGVVQRVTSIGAHHVIWEQGEFDLVSERRPEDIDALINAPWYKYVCIELGSIGFPHAKLIERFGPELNFANVIPGQVIKLEWARRGVNRELDCPFIRDLVAKHESMRSRNVLPNFSNSLN